MRKSNLWIAAILVVAALLGAYAAVAVAGNGHGGNPHTSTATTPQPNSKADNNSGGANGQCPGGPYCSTRNGSPSQNGQGKGKATGKPCAGCVGKADNSSSDPDRPSTRAAKTQ